jgi:hypothetical protein
LEALQKMKVIRLPVAIRKNYADNVRILTRLLNSPVLSKSTIMREFKCLMSHTSLHDSYLINKHLGKKIKQQLKDCDAMDPHSFDYDPLGEFIKKLEERKCDELLEAYSQMLEGRAYPTSVEMMLLYLGVHLYSINGHYARA